MLWPLTVGLLGGLPGATLRGSAQRHGWISIDVPAHAGDDRWELLREWIRTSYTLVAPKKLAKQVLEAEPQRRVDKNARRVQGGDGRVEIKRALRGEVLRQARGILLARHGAPPRRSVKVCAASV